MSYRTGSTTVRGDDALLERLRRGEGTAVRELLAMPRHRAGCVLVRCLCSDDPNGWLAFHAEGYVELLLTHRPPLDEWFAWIGSLPADLDDAQVRYPFDTLRLAAACGVPECADVLREHARTGRHWRAAMWADLEGRRPVLTDTDWSRIVPRLDRDELRGVVADTPAWRRRADAWPAVAHALAAIGTGPSAATPAAGETDEAAATEPDERMPTRPAPAWSLARFRAATYSSRRFQWLKRALHHRPRELPQLLFDGLFDAAARYRWHCIRHVDVGQRGVQRRLQQLAASPLDSARAARLRLAADQPPATT